MVVLLVVELVVLPVPATRLMLPANACPAACPASCCRAVSKVFPAYELLGWYAAAPTGEVDADVLALQAQMAVFNESPLCMVLRTSGVRPDDRQLPLAIYRSDVKGEQQHPAAAARSSPQQQGQLGQCSLTQSCRPLCPQPSSSSSSSVPPSPACCLQAAPSPCRQCRTRLRRPSRSA